MIVPISSGASPFANTGPSVGMPSDTNLLMALATMHAQGRFDTAGPESAGRSHHSPTEKTEKASG